MKKRPSIPSERSETVRQSLLRALRETPATARELSTILGISEKDVAGHLTHLERSLRRTAERFVTEPARCADCGFTFAKRSRLTRPSACPRCRGERIDPPTFEIASKRDE